MIVVEVLNTHRIKVTGEAPWDKIDQLTRFRPNGYQWSSAYQVWIHSHGRRGWDGWSHLMYHAPDTDFGTLPRGLLHRVVSCLSAEGCKFQIIDLFSASQELAALPVSPRWSSQPKHLKPMEDALVQYWIKPKHKIRCIKVDPNILHGKTLRKYQVDAVHAALKYGSGILDMATNAGKTACSAAIMKHYGIPRTLYVLHRKKLQRQTLKNFASMLDVPESEIGVIQGPNFQVGQVTIAMVNSISMSKPQKREGRFQLSPDKAARNKRILALLKSIDLLICDECFDSKTCVLMADGTIKPIIGVRVGDTVAFGGMVKRTFSRQYTGDLYSVGHALATPSHPIFTEQGWMPASQANNHTIWRDLHHEVLYSLRRGVREQKQTWKVQNLQEAYPVPKQNWDLLPLRGIRENGSTRSTYSNKVRSTGALEQGSGLRRSSCSFFGSKKSGTQKKRSGEGKTSCQNGQPYCSCSIQDRLVSRPTEEVFQKRGDRKIPEKGLRSNRKRGDLPIWRSGTWERGCSNKLGNRNGSKTFECGVCQRNNNQNREWISARALQNRSGPHGVEGCSRDRRWKSLWSQSSGNGQKKGSLSNFTWLDGDPVQGAFRLQQSIANVRKTSTPVTCKVYNLETENGVYVAGGILVHNCHHSSSTLWYDSLKRCTAPIKIGMSGTPLSRSDGKNLIIEATTGPVIYSVDQKYLQDRGYSAKVQIRMVEISQPQIEGDWHTILNTGIINNPHLNKRAARIAVREWKQDKQVMILVSKTQQGRRISDMLSQWGGEGIVPHELLHSKVPDHVIDEKQDEFEARDLGILIATPIYGEGVDIPNIDVMVLPDGGKSIIQLLQRIGRGVRKGKEAKTVIVYDLYFTGHEKFKQHARKRRKVYKMEGFEVVEWA